MKLIKKIEFFNDSGFYLELNKLIENKEELNQLQKEIKEKRK